MGWATIWNTRGENGDTRFRLRPVAADIEAKEQGIKRRKNNILGEAAALFDAQCTAFPAALNDRLTAEIANPQAAALPLPGSCVSPPARPPA